MRVNNYETVGELGSGAYSTVKRARNLETNKIYVYLYLNSKNKAMKIIDTREILTKTIMNIEVYDFKKEIKIHDKLVICSY